jgi:hypothetical protein
MIKLWDTIRLNNRSLTCSRPTRSEMLHRRDQNQVPRRRRSAPRRHILPKNLRNAVKHLSDGELDLMHAATLEEMKRRGRLPLGVETDLRSLGHRFNVRPGLPMKRTPAKNQSQRGPVDIPEVSLTPGQVNAVRAAFKAGITPTQIARQFGISQSNVRKG